MSTIEGASKTKPSIQGTKIHSLSPMWDTSATPTTPKERWKLDRFGLDRPPPWELWPDSSRDLFAGQTLPRNHALLGRGAAGRQHRQGRRYRPEVADTKAETIRYYERIGPPGCSAPDGGELSRLFSACQPFDLHPPRSRAWLFD